jgi:hypothetical protein
MILLYNSGVQHTFTFILISQENCSAQPKNNCDCLHVECRIKQIEQPTFTFRFVTSIISTPLFRWNTPNFLIYAFAYGTLFSILSKIFSITYSTHPICRNNTYHCIVTTTSSTTTTATAYHHCHDLIVQNASYRYQK